MAKSDKINDDWTRFTIKPAEIEKRGSINLTNETVNSVRDRLQQIYARPGEPRRVDVIIVMHEEVTDSAGAPITTRDGAGDDPNPGRARGC